MALRHPSQARTARESDSGFDLLKSLRSATSIVVPLSQLAFGPLSSTSLPRSPRSRKGTPPTGFPGRRVAIRDMGVLQWVCRFRGLTFDLL